MRFLSRVTSKEAFRLCGSNPPSLLTWLYRHCWYFLRIISPKYHLLTAPEPARQQSSNVAMLKCQRRSTSATGPATTSATFAADAVTFGASMGSYMALAGTKRVSETEDCSKQRGRRRAYSTTFRSERPGSHHEPLRRSRTKPSVDFAKQVHLPKPTYFESSFVERHDSVPVISRPRL